MSQRAAAAPRRSPAGAAPADSFAPVAEGGGATLVGLALAALVMMAGVAAVDVGALAVARAAAQTAADMAALAAVTPAPGRPLESDQDWRSSRAAEIAAANGAELVACDCSAVQAVVRVRRRVRLVPGGVTVVLTATARAVLGARRNHDWSYRSVRRPAKSRG